MYERRQKQIQIIVDEIDSFKSYQMKHWHCEPFSQKAGLFWIL